jgi:hypothetical protein
VLPGSDLRLPGSGLCSEVLRSPALLCSGSVLRSQVLPGSDLRLPGFGLCSEVLPGSDLWLPGSELLPSPAVLCAGADLRSGSDVLPGPDLQ